MIPCETPVSWVILFFAIVFEVAGTLTLKFTEGMTRLWPTVLMFQRFTSKSASIFPWPLPRFPWELPMPSGRVWER